jgi:hypothetical protein
MSRHFYSLCYSDSVLLSAFSLKTAEIVFVVIIIGLSDGSTAGACGDSFGIVYFPAYSVKSNRYFNKSSRYGVLEALNSRVFYESGKLLSPLLKVVKHIITCTPGA